MTAKKGFPGLDGITKDLHEHLSKFKKVTEIYTLKSSKAVDLDGDLVMASLNAKKVVLLEFETEEKAQNYYNSLKTKD